MKSLQTDSLINGFVERSREILRDNLVGVYLHGSLVMGCFNPQKSDIDLIIVSDRPLSDYDKKAYMEMTVELNALRSREGDRNEHRSSEGMQAVCLSHAL